jgi:hypothetical protein
MSRAYISSELRQFVGERAAHKCEYCLINQQETFIPHQPDHIIAEQHGGQTNADILALAGVDCNRFKGPNIASIDPIFHQLTPLFNPRLHQCADHFALDDAYIRPISPMGRVTTALLRLNDGRRLQIRELLIADGRYP